MNLIDTSTHNQVLFSKAIYRPNWSVTLVRINPGNYLVQLVNSHFIVRPVVYRIPLAPTRKRRYIIILFILYPPNLIPDAEDNIRGNRTTVALKHLVVTSCSGGVRRRINYHSEYIG
ncbi:hypothetical protein QTP88_017788 [Uroleucon formosanum]